MSPESRIIIALKILHEIRTNISKANGYYSGSMTPNLQSICDVLTLPEHIINASLEGFPHFKSSSDDEAELQNMWLSND